MLGDLAKLLVYGYVGSEMGKEVKKRMDERKKEQAEAIQELKNFACVIYDGKAPFTAAQNLAKYLKDKGYVSVAIDPELYRSRLEGTLVEEYSRVIIIGHHDFTKAQMASVDLKSDHCGLKIGVKGRRYVLRARRSDLGRGKQGRREFAAHYDQEMSANRELAEKYGVPTTFGLRSETRESQYDLLWLECVLRLQEEVLSEQLSELFRDIKFVDEPK